MSPFTGGGDPTAHRRARGTPQPTQEPWEPHIPHGSPRNRTPHTRATETPTPHTKAMGTPPHPHTRATGTPTPPHESLGNPTPHMRAMGTPTPQHESHGDPHPPHESHGNPHQSCAPRGWADWPAAHTGPRGRRPVSSGLCCALRVVPSPTGLLSKRGPGLGSFSYPGW